MTLKKLNAAIILTFILTIAYQVLGAYMTSPEGLQYPNPGHHPGEIGPGTFNDSGEANPWWKFPGLIDMDNNKIINVATPTANSDAATKGYVDAQVGVGGDISESEICRWASELRGTMLWDLNGGKSKRVFVTRTAYTGNLGGLAGADKICQAEAEKAGLDGVWKALLSNSTVDARDRIADAQYITNNGGPYWGWTWCGKVIARSKEDLFDGTLEHPFNMDPFGKELGSMVWTGTLPNGKAATTCNDWTTDDGSQHGNAGGSAYTDTEWLDYFTNPNPCNSKYHLYCFEV